MILIGGAWLIRDRVIDDNGGSGNDDPPQADREIVCVEDLREACDALADALDLDIRIEDAATTLDALAALDDPVGGSDLDHDGAVPGDGRRPPRVRRAPEPLADEQIGRLPHRRSRSSCSPIALRRSSTRMWRRRCDWDCVGDAAGDPWTDIGGDDVVGRCSPGVRPDRQRDRTARASADAVSGYFGVVRSSANDPDFVSWARRLWQRGPSQRADRTARAIATIQTRPSALDIAVGAAAEFSDTSASAGSLPNTLTR